jgi:UDP-N-acetyl-D-galactosamine dehydrogenase
VRNTKVLDIVSCLSQYGVNISIFDPWVDSQAAEREYGIEILNKWPSKMYDALILAVAHDEFKDKNILSVLKEHHVVFDVKGLLERQIVDGRL